MVRSAAGKLASKLNSYLKKDGKEYLKLVYGMEVVVMNILFLAVFLVVSLILGFFLQSALVLLGFNVIRRFASGAHAGSTVSCGLSSSILFIVIPWALRGFAIDNFVVAPVFCAVMLILFFYAPADTESKPLVGKKKRAHMKKRALTAAALLALAALLIPSGGAKLLLTLGAVYEAVAILPVTYFVLRKKYRNYMVYEKLSNADLTA